MSEERTQPEPQPQRREGTRRVFHTLQAAYDALVAGQIKPDEQVCVQPMIAPGHLQAQPMLLAADDSVRKV